MERYEQYKDSGIEWLGKIPSEWRMASLKWKSKIFSGGTPDKNRPEYWFNGNIPWLNSGSVNQSIITEPSAFITEDGLKNSSAKWIEKNSVVMALAGQGKTKGMSALVTFRTTCNQSLSVIQPNSDINAKFLLYYLQSNYLHIRALAGEGKRDGLNLEMVGEISIPLLSEVEQTAIANYLDYKTAEIDALIREKERLLELYEEEKAAIINHAVTKGIDPDVALVDSGVEWLGEIPVGWAVKKLKHETYKIGDGIHTTPNYTSGTDFYFINGVNLFDGKITITENTLSVAFDEYEKYKIDLNKGAILISLNGTIGKLAIFDNERVIFGKSAAYIDLKNNVGNHFLYYILKSQYVSNYFEDSFSGTTIKNLSLYTLRNLPIPVPHPLVQKLIVSYIESENIRIDAKISKTKRIIELQKEYRAALISEVVTGKVKVPDLESNEVAQ